MESRADSLKRKKILHNAAALLIIQVANQFLPLLTVPYLTRALGVNAYGAYAYALAIVAIACVVTDFGFNLWATAEVATNRDNRLRIQQLYGEVTGAKLLLLGFCLPMIWIYAANSGIAIEFHCALYLSALPLIGLTLQPIWLFNGLERMTYITIFVIVSRIAFLLLSLNLIVSAEDLPLLMAINGFSQIIAAVLGVIILAKLGYVPIQPRLSDCFNVLKKAFPFFLSRLAVSTYSAGGALFIGAVSGTRSVAIYSVAEQLYRGALAMLSPLSQVMYPYMVRTGNYRVLMKVIGGATLTACLGAAASAYFGSFVIRLLFGDDFIAALPVFQVFLLAIVINTPSVLLGYPMLGSLGKFNLANRSVIVAGGLQVIMLCIWYYLGYTSPVDVATAVLIAELAVLMLRSFWSYRELHYRKN